MSQNGHDTRVARELKRSEERLQSVLDCAFCAYIAIDSGGQIIDWNRQAAATFGYSREEALGKPVVDLLIPPRYRAAHLQGLRKFLESGEGPVLNRRLELAAIN